MDFEAFKEQHGEDAVKEAFMLGVIQGLKQAQEWLRAEFPLFDDNELDEQEHCCEYTLLQERKRLHALIKEREE